MSTTEWKVGVIGLGQMGGGIALNLVRAGCHVTGYDLKPEAIGRLTDARGHKAGSAEEVVAQCDVVLTSLEGKISIRVADTILLPNARAGQVFIDHSTVPAPQTRRIGAAFLEKGCEYLDAPVSGGGGGAANGALRVFVGGDRETAERCWPLFEAIGNPEKIVYGGEIGQGQVVKVVQQLTSRFPDVARLEVMAFGIRGGLDVDTLRRALDIAPDSNDPYARLCRGIETGSIERESGLFSEWAYFLEEAHVQGFRLPILEAMYEFMKDKEKVNADPLGRMMPSIWNALMKAGAPGKES